MIKKITPVVSGIGILLLPSCTTKKAESQRPNIIYIMSDDHAWQAISAYGHPIGKVAPTPNLDRLAASGAIFNRNYCSNSLSGPSRATVLTGMLSHMNGFTHNGEKFQYTRPTFPEILHENGYETAVFGKWHLSNLPRGFDFWKILNDQGTYYNPDIITENDTTRYTGYVTDLVTDFALEWLASRVSADKPFCLMIHHKAPHRNWMPPERMLHRFDSTEIPLPDNYFDTYEGRQAAKEQEMAVNMNLFDGYDLKMSPEKGSDSIVKSPWGDEFSRMNESQKQKLHDSYRIKNDKYHDLHPQGDELAKWKFQRYMQDYLTCVAAVDENVGRVLDYLEKSGLSKNTIVIYTSDQGFYLGEHGWFDKRFMYEESFRMPLIISYPPEIEGGTAINEMTQNIDFAETILDYAGIAIPQEMQGKSLRPLLLGEHPSDWRTSLYYHYYEYPGIHSVKRHYGISTERYKLIHFYNDIDTWELYDLQEDPHEMINQYDNPAFSIIQNDLHHQLDSLRQMYQDTI